MRTLSIKKVCEHCGTSFTARTTTTRFCSDFCAKRAYKRRKRLESAELTNSKSAQTLQENLEKNIPEVMGPRLAAEYMSVHVSTIYRYLACGILKAAQLPGKTLIRKADLDMIFDSPDGYRIRPRLGHTPPKELTTVKATAERYGLSFAGAYKIIKDNKVPTYSIRGKAYYSMSTITSIFRKREENSFPEITEWYTAKEIQENYGMTEAAVYSFASDNGIPRKKVKGVTLYSKPHTDRLKRKDEIKSPDMYTVQECMKRHGMSRDQVYYYLKTYRIERFSRGRYCLFRRKDFDDIFKERRI